MGARLEHRVLPAAAGLILAWTVFGCVKPALGEILVLAYAVEGIDDPFGEVAVLNQIDGITAVGTNDLQDVSAENLANFDVFYAASEYENSLDAKAPILWEYLFNGGAIVVGQANRQGPIDWLPPGLDAWVDSIFYPSPGFFVLTDAGQAHPIFDGLQTDDLGESPSDTIYVDSLGPDWELLMVHSSDPDMVGMAAGSYGAGRILLWPDRYNSDVSDNPSLQFIDQAYRWVSIPAPPALALIGLGALAARRRRGGGT